MKLNSVLSAAVLYAMTFSFYSCRKAVERQLEGSWMKEASVLYSTVDSDSAIWTFNNGKLTINNLTNPQYSDEGDYVVITKKLKNFVRISNLDNFTGMSNLNGDWQVIQYRRDKLTLCKSDRSMVQNPNPPYNMVPMGDKEIGTLLREFTRIQ